jgi:hypothetical protein
MADWPEWSILWEPTGFPESGVSVVEEWSPSHARVAAHPGGVADIDRATMTTTIHMPRRPTPEEIVHPLLASTATIAAHWLGRTPLHAGAFVFDGRVWGLLGDKGAGKTSTLMELHRLGIPVVADDVLVVDAASATAFVGPRCLDLRRDAHEHFREGRPLGIVGTRARWRVDLPEALPEFPLAGWVLLEWAQETRLWQPTAAIRMTALAAHRALIAKGSHEQGLLDLVTSPMVVFGRPKGWVHLDGALDVLLGDLAALARTPSAGVAERRSGD